MKAILSSFKVKEGHCPHSLGAQSISRYCENRGYGVGLMSIPLNVERASEEILAFDCSVIGFSSNYVTEPYIIEIVKRIKEAKGDKVLVVIGGPSITYSSAESRIRRSHADVFVRGDGEEVFYQIIRNNPQSVLEGKLNPPGISTKKNPNESIAQVNLESLSSPFPIHFETDHVYWETVRGCAFSCIYCAHPGQINKFRNIPLQRISEETDYLANKRFGAIYITDPILGGTKERSKQILRLLKKLKGSFITAEYRPEYLDSETIDLLEEAEIGWLEFGLQTTNPNLRYFRRNGSRSMDKLIELSKRGIKYSLDLICGIPGDNRESFENSLKFAVENARPTSLKVFPLRVYEGTVLHKMAEENTLWKYDKDTRIIKQSHSFDEAELKEWMRLGRTTAHIYRFLEENNWFGRQRELRNMNFFKHCSNLFWGEIQEPYNAEEIEKIWVKIQKQVLKMQGDKTSN